MISLLILSSTGVLNQLFIGGRFKEEVTPCKKSVLKIYYIRVIDYVDCNITGSNYGIPKYKKFQLNIILEKCIFPVIKKLVCDGVPLERFATNTQGENSGPHQEKKGQVCSELL